MQPNMDVRRHSDGSIDFDFYRRRAVRQRRLTRRLAVRHYVGVARDVMRATASAIERPLAILLPTQRGLRLAASAAVAGALLAAVGLQVWAQHAEGHAMVGPAELKWAALPSLPPGAQIAVIQGPMHESKPFIARLRFPPNYKVPAHSHPAIEHVTVLAGTFHMGVGDKLDVARTRALTVGSVAIMQAGTNHFAWTSEETVLQLHGVGPWGITYVDPADDPRKK